MPSCKGLSAASAAQPRNKNQIERASVRQASCGAQAKLVGVVPERDFVRWPRCDGGLVARRGVPDVHPEGEVRFGLHRPNPTGLARAPRYLYAMFLHTV